MMDEKNYTIDIENLSVRYETADGVVEAVNGIDLKNRAWKNPGPGGRNRRRKDHNRSFYAAADSQPAGKNHRRNH